MEDRNTSNHNPPDNINFYFQKFNGKNRQVYNFEIALENELKKKGFWKLHLFGTFPSKRRPVQAYQSVEDGTSTKHEHQEIDRYEEYQQKENDMITRATVLIQSMVTSDVYSDYQRYVSQVQQKVNPKYTEREVFSYSTDFFIEKYRSARKLNKTMSELIREMEEIPPAAKIHEVKPLLQKMMDKFGTA